MALQTFIEWPDERRRDRYPFADVASLVSTGGDLTLRNEWFRDARLWPEVADGRVYLSRIEISGDILTMEVRDRTRVLCRATVGETRAVFFDGSYQVGFIQLELGARAAIKAAAGDGVYRFSQTGGELVPTVVTPRVISGLEAVSVGGDALDTTTIRVVGGEGVRLVPSGSELRVDIIGDDLYRRDACEDPATLGRLMGPVRNLAWEDANSGEAGQVVPKRGNLLLAVTETRFSSGGRGFRAPGTGQSLIERIN